MRICSLNGPFFGTIFLEKSTPFENNLDCFIGIIEMNETTIKILDHQGTA